MTKRSTELNKKVDEWLESLGFTLGNPFASVEAEQERDLLPRFFVDVPEVDEIRGEKSMIVFAPRGGGKTALRVMLADKTAPRDMSQTVLSVEFTDFDGLMWHYRQETLNSESAVRALLEAGANTLLSYLLEKPVDNMSDLVKINLAQFLHTQMPSIWAPNNLLTRLNEASTEVSLTAMGMSWEEFRQHIEDRSLSPYVYSVTEQPSARLLAELNDLRLSNSSDMRPLQRLESFVDVCRGIGLNSVFFLVDRVDEFPETVNNPELQAELLLPYLGHLPILEKAGVAFKFFLPNMVRDELESPAWLRLDRIRIKTSRLNWDGKRLVQLLNERMGVFSRRQVTDLGQICESKEVADRIEGWIGTAVSPRHLLLTMQKMCEAHVAQVGPEGPITSADWHAAKGGWLMDGGGDTGIAIPSESELSELKPDDSPDPPIFSPEGTPLLRIKIAQHLVWVGEQPVKLTGNEFEVLKALAEAEDGRCSRDSLAQQVWENDRGVISEEAIDKTIGRLRKSLGDTGKKQTYLETVRGWGFQLNNYVNLE